MKQNRRPIGMSSRYSRPSRARGLKPRPVRQEMSLNIRVHHGRVD
ncbi:hypothetical protein [Psychrobacter sp. LFX-11D]